MQNAATSSSFSIPSNNMPPGSLKTTSDPLLAPTSGFFKNLDVVNVTGSGKMQ